MDKISLLTLEDVEAKTRFRAAKWDCEGMWPKISVYFIRRKGKFSVNPLPARFGDVDNYPIQWRGNYFRTGGQSQERQSLEREIRFFAEIGLFLSQKQAFSKKKKRLRRNRSVFLSQKWPRIQV